jgi:hypothetical protein
MVSVLSGPVFAVFQAASLPWFGNIAVVVEATARDRTGNSRWAP